MPKTIQIQRDDSAVVIAAMFGVTPDYVRKVAKGKRNNPTILQTYQEYKAGKSYLKTNLIKAVEKAIAV